MKHNIHYRMMSHSPWDQCLSCHAGQESPGIIDTTDTTDWGSDISLVESLIAPHECVKQIRMSLDYIEWTHILLDYRSQISELSDSIGESSWHRNIFSPETAYDLGQWPIINNVRIIHTFGANSPICGWIDSVLSRTIWPRFLFCLFSGLALSDNAPSHNL